MLSAVHDATGACERRAAFVGLGRAGHGSVERSTRAVPGQDLSKPVVDLDRPGTEKQSLRDLVGSAMQKLPTIGPVAAKKLLDMFGENLLGTMLEDNVYEFINLMDENGNLVFSDRQAGRLERSMATFEFSIGQGGYQATEFIKRYLPRTTSGCWSSTRP